MVELRDCDPGRRVLTLDLPGHGGSADAFAGLGAVVSQINAAVEDAGLRAPVLVGHSVSGVVATFYAAGLPCRGVVNVDQPLVVEPFAQFLQSMRARLTDPDLASVWAELVESWHPQLLGAEYEAFVREKSRPRTDVVLEYWAPLLEFGPDGVAATMRTTLGAVRAANTPYLSVLGAEPGQEYRRWLGDLMPHATTVVLEDSGHFPQLRHVEEFARIVASTARWPAASTIVDEARSVVH